MLPRAELHPGGGHDALRGGCCKGVPTSRDRRAARRDEAGRAVRHGEGDGGAHGNRPGDPFGAAARARRPPGGDLRRAGGDADDPGTTRPLERRSSRESYWRSRGCEKFRRASRSVSTPSCDHVRRRRSHAAAVDAIVNAANEALAPGGGVCGAIRRAGGDEIFEECARWAVCDGRCESDERRPAQARSSSTPSARCGAGEGGDGLLASAYRRALEVAEELGCRTIAFPALSTGIMDTPSTGSASRGRCRSRARGSLRRDPLRLPRRRIGRSRPPSRRSASASSLGSPREAPGGGAPRPEPFLLRPHPRHECVHRLHHEEEDRCGRRRGT